MLQVYVPPHPLIKHWLAIARNKYSPTPIFRAAIAELGRLLVYELARDWLPVVEGQIESPVGPADAQYVDPARPIKVVFKSNKLFPPPNAVTALLPGAANLIQAPCGLCSPLHVA